MVVQNTLRKLQRGFTLIELMIVIMIVLILAGVAVPKYSQSVARARESALRQNLYHMRQVIDQYTMDKQRAPQSLEDLVSAGYLREIPKDPISGTADTWEVVQEDVMQTIDQTQPGISDVRSGAQGTASDGTAYNSW